MSQPEMPPQPPAQPVQPAAPPKRSNGLALIAFIIAVVAFVLGFVPFIGFVTWLIAIVAVILAIVALSRTGLPKGLAIAGVIIGVIAIFSGPIAAVGSVIGVATPSVNKAVAAASSAAAAPPAADAPSEAPSAAEEPSETPTATPVETKVYSGRGDKVLKVDYDAVLIAKFSCSGCSGNTSLETDSGTSTLPVNTIGRYAGRFLLNAGDGDLLTKVVIHADSAWKLTLTAAENATVQHVTPGETVKGHGDDVIFVESGVTDSDVRNVGSGNFSLTSYGGSDSLPVNEIGSYKGNVELDGPAVVQVTSDGDWSVKGNG